MARSKRTPAMHIRHLVFSLGHSISNAGGIIARVLQCPISQWRSSPSSLIFFPSLGLLLKW